MLDKLNQNYFSPYLIFIKEGFKMSDNQILKNLGLSEFKIVSKKGRNIKELTKRYLFLTEDSKWTHLMDDWGAGIGFNEDINYRIHKLSKQYEIFTCGVQDYGFDFIYQRNGKIIRQYEFDIEKTESKRVIKNIGVPFPIEREALNKEDDYEKIIMIAKSLGIKFDYQKERIRIYSRPETEKEKIFFNEEEY